MTRPGSVMMVRPPCCVSCRLERKSSMRRGPCGDVPGAMTLSAAGGGGGRGAVTVGAPWGAAGAAGAATGGVAGADGEAGAARGDVGAASGVDLGAADLGAVDLGAADWGADVGVSDDDPAAGVFSSGEVWRPRWCSGALPGADLRLSDDEPGACSAGATCLRGRRCSDAGSEVEPDLASAGVDGGFGVAGGLTDWGDGAAFGGLGGTGGVACWAGAAGLGVAGRPTAGGSGALGGVT